MLLKIVFATRNSNKIKEISLLFKNIGVELLSLNNFSNIPEIEETGSTFEENATIKADSVFNILGLPTIADDSGLVVPALNNEPGIYSARYAGENANDSENNLLLLKNMQNIPEDKRSASFVCAIAFKYKKSQKTLLFSAETTGKILTKPRGEQGFGYDPLFLSDELGITLAEADLKRKNSISHRGKAIQMLIEYLKNNKNILS